MKIKKIGQQFWVLRTFVRTICTCLSNTVYNHICSKNG